MSKFNKLFEDIMSEGKEKYSINHFGPFDSYWVRFGKIALRRADVPSGTKGLLPNNAQFNNVANFKTEKDLINYLKKAGY